MTLPMAALMLRHRHGWRPITEMAAAMILPTLAATLLHLIGAIPAGAVMSVGHLTMIPAMLAVMLVRLDPPDPRQRPEGTHVQRLCCLGLRLCLLTAAGNGWRR